MLRGVHVVIDDVIFAADQHAGRSFVGVRECRLSSGNLYEQVSPSVSRTAPLAHNVVETEVQFVVRKHLKRIEDQYILALEVYLGAPSLHC